MCENEMCVIHAPFAVIITMYRQEDFKLLSDKLYVFKIFQIYSLVEIFHQLVRNGDFGGRCRKQWVKMMCALFVHLCS